MRNIFSSSIMVIKALGLTCSGCATKPYDYTNLRSYKPRSILVLPPVNESTDVKGTYGYLSTVTMPLAEPAIAFTAALNPLYPDPEGILNAYINGSVIDTTGLAEYPEPGLTPERYAIVPTS